MWREAAVGTLLGLVLTACGQAVAGVPHIGDGGCVPVTEDSPRSPSTPTTEPVITVDDRVSFWIPNSHTAPLGLAVYADGTVISAGSNGSHAEPLTPMTIGLVDGCRIQESVDALVALAGADFGMPGITDQAVTTVTVTRPGSETVILSAYALGIGDDYVGRAEAAARATLTATLEAIVHATSAEEPWAPDRLQFTRFEYDVPGPPQPWPLAGSIADLLHQRTYGGLSCGVVDGADAAAITAASGRQPALSSWDDGRDTESLAVGVLVPGQPACVG
jgi:hypothetical protein